MRWEENYLECRHRNKKVVWTDVSTAGDQLPRKHLRYQCCDCGMLFSNDLSRSMARSDTPNVDKLALLEYSQKRRGVREDLRAESLSALKEKRALHAEYLLTDGWKARRKLVMERAGWVCEGCRINRATQVHHLTYDNWGSEFLWELVAICGECHGRVHEDREPDIE